MFTPSPLSAQQFVLGAVRLGCASFTTGSAKGKSNNAHRQIPENKASYMETPQCNGGIRTLILGDLICLAGNACCEILSTAGEHLGGAVNAQDAGAWLDAKSCLCF